MKIPRITSILAGVIIIFHAFFGHAGAGGIASKPQQPVTVSIGLALPGTAEDAPQPGDVVEFSATASALVDATDLRLEVKLLGAVELVNGTLDWRGSSKKGSRKSVYFTVRIPENGKGRIKAVATLLREGRRPVHSTSMYLLGRTDEGAQFRQRKDHKDRNIVEY